jgi:hypothetical protein
MIVREISTLTVPIPLAIKEVVPRHQQLKR